MTAKLSKPKTPGADGQQGSAGKRSAGSRGGVVRRLVCGRSGPSVSALVQELQAGLPVSELVDLQSSLGVPMEKLSGMLGISKSTLHRRKTAQRLPMAESDRIVRFARLMSQAVGVFESEENARRWLSSPQVGLGGAVPLEFARTEVGAREVEDLLGRIDQGVYS